MLRRYLKQRIDLIALAMQHLAALAPHSNR
jgi:hypothetical protein